MPLVAKICVRQPHAIKGATYVGSGVVNAASAALEAMGTPLTQLVLDKTQKLAAKRARSTSAALCVRRFEANHRELPNVNSPQQDREVLPDIL